MAKENVRLFFKKIISDKKLKDAYERLSKQHEEQFAEKVVEFACANGMPFSKEEMRQWISEQVKMNNKMLDQKTETILYIDEGDTNVKFIDEFEHSDDYSTYSFGKWNFIH